MIDFIVNIKAGKGKCRESIEAIRKELDGRGIAYRVHETEHPRHATEIARELCESGAKKIVAVGGDGSVNEVLNGLTRLEDITLGIIPAGTGNDFATAVGIPEDALAALNIILDGNSRRVDFYECNGVRGINAIGTGIDVDILRHYSKARRQNKLQYTRSLLHCLAHYKPYTVANIDENGLKHEKKVLILCLCNGTQFGGGIRICPEADPYDGKLHLVIVRAIPKPRIPFELPKLMKGKIRKIPESEISTLTELKLEGSFPVQIDGEIYENFPFDVRIIPGKLNLFVK